MKIHTSGARHLGIFLPNFTLLLKLLTGAISSFPFDGQNWKGRASSSQRKRNLCDSVGNRPLTLILTTHSRTRTRCACVRKRQNPLQKITSLLNYWLNMRLVLQNIYLFSHNPLVLYKYIPKSFIKRTNSKRTLVLEALIVQEFHVSFIPTHSWRGNYICTYVCVRGQDEL